MNKKKLGWRERYARNLSIVNAFRDGATIGDLASKHKMTYPAVRIILVEDGLDVRAKKAEPKPKPARKRGRPSNTNRNLSLVVDYVAGVSISDMQSKYGITSARIYQILGKAGVPYRGGKKLCEFRRRQRREAAVA